MRIIIDKFLSKYLYFILSCEEIFGVLCMSDVLLVVNDIVEVLLIKCQECEGFFWCVVVMECDGQICFDKCGYYQLIYLLNFVVGCVQGYCDGYGFVICDDGQDDLFLLNGEMQKVMYNDCVFVWIVGYDCCGWLEGYVVEVMDCVNKCVIGCLLNENGVLIVVLEDKCIGYDILIMQNVKKVKVGQVVVVELIDFLSCYLQLFGCVVEVFGDIDDLGMEIEIVVCKYGVLYEFSQLVFDEVVVLFDKVWLVDLCFCVDLCDVLFVMIDGEDVCDFDDVVYCELVKVGCGDGFWLIVVIVDVLYYVQLGIGFDVDVFECSILVYFLCCVILMLLEKLLNGFCLLNLQVDCCVFVCDMVIIVCGEIKVYQFYLVVIYLVVCFMYIEVVVVLLNMKGLEVVCCVDLLLYLQDLYGVYKLLFVVCQKCGVIDFDMIEIYIVCNLQGKIE